MDMRTSELIVAVMLRERMDAAAKWRRETALRPRRPGWFARFRQLRWLDVADARAALPTG